MQRWSSLNKNEILVNAEEIAEELMERAEQKKKRVKWPK